jgi:hypothetical protein
MISIKQWNYGDGASDATGQHTYTACGTFQVTVVFQDTATDSTKDADVTSGAFSLTVGANWSVGDPIQCVGITSPSDGTRVPPNAEIAVTCGLATDTDIRNCGTPTSTPDTCTYTWSATGGAFKNQVTQGQSVTWIAPLLRASYTITVNVDDSGAIPAGDCGTRDDPVRSFHITVYCCDHQHPVNFHQTIGEVDPLNPKTLYFYYVWESPTGVANDLNTCVVGEIVTYPGPAPNPPFANFAPGNVQNLDKPGPQLWLEDHHYPPLGGFDPQHPNPAQYPVYEATQSYAFNCSVCMAPGAYQVMPGAVPEPHHIDRYIEVSDPNPPVVYQYRIVKTGVTGTFPAEP